ncbi:hypothetical protein KWH04_09335, partial [Xanthomonas campestris pv. trichodesmae]|nr:hypothetical protein [Xanthomonas campestris pv. trichodesmae]
MSSIKVNPRERTTGIKTLPSVDHSSLVKVHTRRNRLRMGGKKWPTNDVGQTVILQILRDGLINSPQMRDTTASCRGFIHAAD